MKYLGKYICVDVKSRSDFFYQNAIVKIYDMELQYISGAQFIATKQCIQSLPLLFYQKSLELTYTNLFSGTHFEFMWLYIMGHNKYICKETMKYIKENNFQRYAYGFIAFNT